MKEVRREIQGGFVLVDEEYAHLLDNHNWRKDPYGYALTVITLNDGTEFPMRLHQMILGHVPRSSGIVIDHINRKPYDNRRENLRYATRKQNLENSSRWDR